MIQLENYTKYFHYGSVNQVLALSDINLDIKKGDFVTIIGSNGAGKSTLLNCLAGTFICDSGKLIINDIDVTRYPEYKRARYIGRVFQDPMTGTCGSLSIEQNMALALKRGKKKGLGLGVKSKDRSLFKEQLEKLNLGLEKRLNDNVELLSGGQRQALTMLMATMLEPEVLLLDEHTAALDPKTAHQIIELTSDIVEKQNLTTLMVTHNMNQALKMGNRLIMLHRGGIIQDIKEEEKRTLTVDDLLAKFYDVKEDDVVSDRMLLA